MQVLLVHAHENADSFCSSLAKKTKSSLEAMGHTVAISDLYLKNFNPIGGKHDFIQLSNADYYKYASEQMHAHQQDGFTLELKEEMQQLLAADVLIFNFPLWWFGMPAILKGWVDRVLAYGFAYGGEYGFFDEGRFKGKHAFLCVTTGSGAAMYTTTEGHGRTLSDILKNINEGILGLIGFTVLPEFTAYSVSRIDDAERKEILKKYEAYLKKHFA